MKLISGPMLLRLGNFFSATECMLVLVAFQTRQKFSKVKKKRKRKDHAVKCFLNHELNFEIPSMT